MATITPPPGRAPADPAPALRALFEMPLKHPLGPEIEAKIDALEAVSRGDGPEWPAIYREAIAIVEEMVAAWGRKVDGVQGQLLAAEDPNELRQRLAVTPRRDAERSFADAKAELARVVKEWSERAGRQAEQVQRQLEEEGARSIAVSEAPRTGGIDVQVDRAWWDQFSGYVARCLDEWSRRYQPGVDEALRRAIAPLALLPQARGSAVPGLDAPVPPPILGAMGEPPVPKVVEVPSFGSALGAYVRTNLMSVTMVGSMATGVIGLVTALSGESSSGTSTLVRGGVLVLALPFVLGFGVIAADRQKGDIAQKGVEAQREATRKHLTAAIAAATDRHRKSLDRWTAERLQGYQSALSRWWTLAVEPQLAASETNAANVAREVRHQQALLQEELGQLKSTRKTWQDSLLFDLRKRARELGPG